MWGSCVWVCVCVDSGRERPHRLCGESTCLCFCGYVAVSACGSWVGGTMHLAACVHSLVYIFRCVWKFIQRESERERDCIVISACDHVSRMPLPVCVQTKCHTNYRLDSVGLWTLISLHLAVTTLCYCIVLNMDPLMGAVNLGFGKDQAAACIVLF